MMTAKERRESEGLSVIIDQIEKDARYIAGQISERKGEEIDARQLFAHPLLADLECLYGKVTVLIECSGSDSVDEKRAFKLQKYLQECEDTYVARFILPNIPHPRPNVTVLFALFLSSLNCDAVVGDLQERYATAIARRGRYRAILWFWRQVITSLAPLAWASLKRVSGLEAIQRRIGR
jgi:hypothetical protein